MKIHSRESYERIVTAIRNELIYADLHYGLFAQLDASFTEYRREVGRSPIFWGMARDSFKDLAVLGLCRVYDVTKTANSLPNLLIGIRSNILKCGTAFPFDESHSFKIGIDGDQLEADINWVSRENPPAQRLGTWRDKILAHSDGSNVAAGRTLNKENIPKYEDLRLLIEQGMEIVSRYSNAYMSHGINDLFVPREDFQFVLECVRECLKVSDTALIAEAEKFGLKPDYFLRH